MEEEGNQTNVVTCFCNFSHLEERCTHAQIPQKSERRGGSSFFVIRHLFTIHLIYRSSCLSFRFSFLLEYVTSEMKPGLSMFTLHTLLGVVGVNR